MDQDFHYYGTYFAAKTGGFSNKDATLLARASNFIDFFTAGSYASYWALVPNEVPQKNYKVLATVDNPRYTFQDNKSILFGVEDSLWCSYHFIPGNYKHPAATPSKTAVHGKAVSSLLPEFEVRDATGGKSILKNYHPEAPAYMADLEFGALLTRPQSSLSLELIEDTVKCFNDDDRIKEIFKYAKGGAYLLKDNDPDVIRRFKLILLGVRAHVIADTWGHQDFCGTKNVMNTYWDVDYDPKSLNIFKMGLGRQSINYREHGQTPWKNKVLSASEADNFKAVPNAVCYLGHGWMGHLPDYSFVEYQYKPCWSNPEKVVTRNNPEQYRFAWIELASLFHRAKFNTHLQTGSEFDDALNKAVNSISAPGNLDTKRTARKSSEMAWLKNNTDHPEVMIDCDKESDDKLTLEGMLDTAAYRNGTSYVNVKSDLYLFQIAVDYHFHFVKNYLEEHEIHTFKGGWADREGPLSSNVSYLFSARENAVT